MTMHTSAPKGNVLLPNECKKLLTVSNCICWSSSVSCWVVERLHATCAASSLHGMCCMYGLCPRLMLALVPSRQLEPLSRPAEGCSRHSLLSCWTNVLPWLFLSSRGVHKHHRHHSPQRAGICLSDESRRPRGEHHHSLEARGRHIHVALSHGTLVTACARTSHSAAMHSS